ncbi:MAG: hypothetical protein KDA37_08045 [Planctomycetales bacterium]|nr:hypothetical protein [Planctomycetales bacterium]
MSDTLLGGTGFDGGDGAFIVAPSSGPVCEKCEASLPSESMTACPHCGWYPALNTYVEIQQEWEQACSGQAASPAKSAVEVWTNLIPAWGWKLIATTVLMAGASLGARFYVADKPDLHVIWAVVQFFAGILVVLACHLLAFFMAASNDPDMGVMDLVVNPLRAWLRLFAGLPKRLWVANTANVGLSATLFAALIIGGLPYEEIWNWGIKPPAKKNLLGAIASKAGGGEGDMSMDDALDSFAQNAALSDDLAGGDSKKKLPKEVQRQTIDALILGFEMAQDGSIDRLLLATEHNGRLYYAGRVVPNFTEEEAKDLPPRFMAARSPRPFVSVPGSAMWLKPRFTCRVTYNKRVESGMLQGIMWEEMLGEIRSTAPSVQQKAQELMFDN